MQWDKLIDCRNVRADILLAHLFWNAKIQSEDSEEQRLEQLRVYGKKGELDDCRMVLGQFPFANVETHWGRKIKIDFVDYPFLDPREYNKENGEGLLEKLVKVLEEGQKKIECYA